jgi:hypothetical protein
MEGWRDGGMEGWRDRGMEGWRDGLPLATSCLAKVKGRSSVPFWASKSEVTCEVEPKIGNRGGINVQVTCKALNPSEL